MLNLENAALAGKKVIVRVDLNVPILHGKVTDTERIERILPTIHYLRSRNSKVILMSHFGRPKGSFNLDMSLAPIVDKLQEFLPNITVKFAVDCRGQKAQDAVSGLQVGEVLMLENLRFYKEEAENDVEFSKELASYADLYINDSFSCSHRSHSSIEGITKFLPSYPGLLLTEEISTLEKYLTNPKKPMISIVGGSKVSTKIILLKHLAVCSHAIVIGGAMANTFLKAQNIDVKKSLVEDDFLDVAKEILIIAQQNNCEIILPEDVVVAKNITDSFDVKVVSVNAVPDDYMILDIGPQAVGYIASKLADSKTVLWNGPLGAFEFRPFNIGSESIARHISLLTSQGKMISIAGGGDVVASVKGSGLKNTFTYISTAGGAFLAWLEGKDLPGIRALKEAN
ncbi:MAG: phosphoglycerate kinase [Rickettsiales bacterium]|nr:phosphoglycerate kinase [Rickettsiales bacterium]